MHQKYDAYKNYYETNILATYWKKGKAQALKPDHLCEERWWNMNIRGWENEELARS